jgi:tryptophan-rich sensory protein
MCEQSERIVYMNNKDEKIYFSKLLVVMFIVETIASLIYFYIQTKMELVCNVGPCFFFQDLSIN